MKFEIGMPVYFFTIIDKIPGVIHAAKQDEYGNWIYEVRVGDSMVCCNIREQHIKERTIIDSPIYQNGEKVKFRFNEDVIVGIIKIVDAYGTFEQDEEPSYDIMSEGSTRYLYKHVRESNVIGTVE